MPAFSKPRLMIALAFAAGAASTAAFIAIGSDRTMTSQEGTEAKLPASAVASPAESGLGSWVDPNQPATTKHAAGVVSPNLVFQAEAPTEEPRDIPDQANKLASGLAVPVPPRRPEHFRIIANSADRNARTLATEDRVRKIVVPNQADSTPRNKKAVQFSVQRHAGTKEDTAKREIPEPRQHVTSTQPNGVMQWLIEPSRF
ncbi:hypothetical protein BV511_02175 [Methylorubrum extorquens]|nr:hypothetical protein BV511_02175 [Methylorubrum extorquens]